MTSLSEIRTQHRAFSLCWNKTKSYFFKFNPSITYSMEQNPFEKLTGSQLVKEFPAFFGTPKVHYRIHKCPPPFLILSQLDPVRAPHLTSWRSLLILSSHLRLRLPSGLLPSGFPTKNPANASPLPHTCYMPRSSHSRFDNPNSTGWGVQIIKLLIM